MSIKKNIIKEALLNAKEIEDFAMKSAKKTIEESMAPQIEKAIMDSIREMEALNNTEIQEEVVVEEGIKLDIAPDADLTINVSSDGATIEVGSDTDTIDTLNQEPEMNNTPESQDDEIFEIEGLSEEDAVPMAPPAETVAEPEANISTINDKLEDLTSKIDSILSVVNPTAGQGGEGEVEVVDDDNAGADIPGMDPAAQAAPAPAAPAAPAMPQDDTVVNEDDIMFELEDDSFMEGIFNEIDFVTEDSLDEINLDELEGIDELEIVDEEEIAEGEPVEEMRGMSHTVQRSAGNRQNFEKNNQKHAPIGVNEGVGKIKAQYESKIDELIQENEGLKNAITKFKNENVEYKNAFVELRKQVNEMQTFNGKLAYANQLLNKAGVTAEEKLRIAEEFDKTTTVEEAKKLYNRLLSEMKNSTSTSPIDKLKSSAKSQVIQPKEQAPKEEVVFLSEERKKMLRLAGILNENQNS